jgi:hypothetical protein
MPFELSLPIFAASGVAFCAVMTYLGWPHIRIRTYNKIHGGLRVVEIAFILSRAARARQPALGEPARDAPGAEFVIYMTLKTGNL